MSQIPKMHGQCLGANSFGINSTLASMGGKHISEVLQKVVAMQCILSTILEISSLLALMAASIPQVFLNAQHRLCNSTVVHREHTLKILSVLKPSGAYLT